jgi:cysteine desulfurase
MTPPPHAPVYLDHHATTPLDPRVFEAMRPWLEGGPAGRFGNPSSRQHAFGEAASTAVEQARAQLAALLDVSPLDVIFTSGATEANNLALKGTLLSRRGEPTGRLVTSTAEHRATLDPARSLSRRGVPVTFLPVDPLGRISLAELDSALASTPASETRLVSLLAANNEVGTLAPLAEITDLCRRRGVSFHTDACAAVGHFPCDAPAYGADLLSLSAHKFYGPQGIGALIVREGVRPLVPQIEGGGHERHLRSGSLPVALIVGMGAAAAIAQSELPSEQTQLAALRDHLWARLHTLVPDLIRNGDPVHTLPGTLNISVPDVDGDRLLAAITDLAVSSGAACSSRDPEPSHVLRAMGLSEQLAKASLRLSLGRFTTRAEIDFAANSLAQTIRQLRGHPGRP